MLTMARRDEIKKAVDDAVIGWKNDGFPAEKIKAILQYSLTKGNSDQKNQSNAGYDALLIVAFQNYQDKSEDEYHRACVQAKIEVLTHQIKDAASTAALITQKQAEASKQLETKALKTKFDTAVANFVQNRTSFRTLADSIAVQESCADSYSNYKSSAVSETDSSRLTELRTKIAEGATEIRRLVDGHGFEAPAELLYYESQNTSVKPSNGDCTIS